MATIETGNGMCETVLYIMPSITWININFLLLYLPVFLLVLFQKLLVLQLLQTNLDFVLVHLDHRNQEPSQNIQSGRQKNRRDIAVVNNNY